MRLVSFNLESRGFLDNLIRPNIYRTRLTSLREHKSLVLGLIISSKVSSFRDSKFLAECFIIYVCCLSFVLCHRQIFVCSILIIVDLLFILFLLRYARGSDGLIIQRTYILFCYYFPMTAFVRTNTANYALFLQILEMNLYITWSDSYFLSNRISRRVRILPYISHYFGTYRR